MKVIRVGGLFSGVGAHVSACDRFESDSLHFRHVFQGDIDKRAINAFNLMHGETVNLGDVKEIHDLSGDLAVDWLFWTPCCQDISPANPSAQGNARGSGTRSSLAFEVPRILENTPAQDRPEYLIMEEVPTMIRKYKANFDEILERLSALGYAHTYGTMSAVDCGVAQTRRRAYCISRLNARPPEMPKPIPLDKCLADYLESEPDPKYYLSPERVKGLILSNKGEREAGRGFECVPTDGSSLAHTLTCKCGGRAKTENFIMTDKDSIEAWLDSGNKCIVNHCVQVGTLSVKGFDCIKRVYSTEGCCPTIPTGAGGGAYAKNID